MLKKISLIAATAVSLSALAYLSMTVNTVMQSDPRTVLTLNTSEQSPMATRIVADLRVRTWKACPIVDGGVSLIGQTLRGHGLEGFDNRRVLRAAGLLIETGCDMNKLGSNGQAPIHEAILYNEAEVVRYLLTRGANPAIAISSPQAVRSAALRHYDGMNALEFARELDSRADSVSHRGEIVALLRGHSG